jgi:tetratricopeptide (TPR) repeat protein
MLWARSMASINEKLLDRTLNLVVNRERAPQSSVLPRRLDSLFRELRSETPSRDPGELMELIWALWIDHPESGASARLIAAVEAIQAGARDLARPMLDDLVDRYPDWAEAWNKRATLAFIERRDAECLDDIARTLELEPRHVGAILGFAQICLRHRRNVEAKAAFETALSLNPHMGELADVVRDLAGSGRTLH